MAWPLSRHTTFTSNTTPAITKAFLDAVQDAIVKLHDGTISLKSILVDGTGGIAAAIPAGEIRALVLRAGQLLLTGTASGTTTPTTVVDRGRGYLEGLPVGWAKLRWGGGALTLGRGYNIHSVSRSSKGIYVVTLGTNPTAPADAVAVANAGTPDLGSPGDLYAACITADSGGRCQVTIRLTDHLNAVQDADVNLVVFGY